MLDITIIFVIAGLLFGATRQPARGVGRLALPQVQWIAGGIIVLFGIFYAIVLIMTSPAYYNFTASFSGVRLVLIKLLPSTLLGLVAGIILRMGMRQEKGYFLGLGAVFVILPFLLSEAPSLLKNFQKIKVGPWFEADIQGTVKKSPVELKIQDFLNKYQTDTDPIGKEKHALLLLNAIIDLKMDNIYLHRDGIISNNVRQKTANNHALRNINSAKNAYKTDTATPQHFSNIDIFNVDLPVFVSNYINPLIKCAQTGEDQLLSKENRLREVLEPYVVKSAKLLTLSATKDWSKEAGKIADELRPTLNALGRLANEPPQNVIGSVSPAQLNAVSLGGGNACNSIANPLPPIPENDIKESSLPVILLSRLYRRLGNDKSALDLLEHADLRFYVPDPTKDIKTHRQARFLIERGNLRKDLEKDGWEKDWRRAIDFLQSRLNEMISLAKTCENGCDEIEKYITHIRLETAQLRNDYLFRFIQDTNRWQEPDDDAPSLADIVDEALLNYNSIGEISKIDEEIQRGKSPISKMYCPAGGSTIKPCQKLCASVFYTDTYALALMAQASLESNGAMEHAGIRIIDLLNEAMYDLLTNCLERKQELKGVIRQHQKIARDRFPDASAGAPAQGPRARGTLSVVR